MQALVGDGFTKELARQPVGLIVREAARPPPVEDRRANESGPKVARVDVPNGPLGRGRWHALDECHVFRTQPCEMERKLTWCGPSNAHAWCESDVDLRRVHVRQLVQRKCGDM
jgi:hypothetical protein